MTRRAPFAVSTVAIVLLLSLLAPSGSQASLRHLDNWLDSWNNEYDYIVVGAGTAGCVVAQKLSQAGHRVKVLEKGSRIPDDNINSQILGLATQNWVPPFAADHVMLPNSMGARPLVIVGDVEGGGGMINSAIAHLGAKSWWNSFGTNWDFDTHITPAFNRLRSKLSLQPPAMVPESAEKFIASGANVSFLNNDLNDPLGTPTEGFGNLSLATKSSMIGPVRDSTLFAYLDKAGHLVSVSLRAEVTRIKFKTHPSKLPRARAVEYIEEGECKVARARKGVILTAGTYGSADILLRSGVGPQADLTALGIPTMADLPVGEGLKDHHVVSVTYQNNCPMDPAQLPLFGLTPATQVAGFLRSTASVHLWPDIQYTFVPLAAGAAGVALDQFTIAVFLVDPESNGSVRLATAGGAGVDPLKPTLKSYDYPGTTRDVNALVSGITIAEEFMAIPPFSTCLGARITPPVGTPLASWVAATASPGYHISSTCAIGRVVDANLKVMGTRGLFVADASVMPQVAPCNTNIPTAVIAERGVELILAAVP